MNAKTTTPVRPLSIVHLAGTQVQMGAQFGEITKRRIPALLDYYRRMPKNLVRPASRASWTDGALFSALSPVLERQLRTLDRHRVPAFRARTLAGLRASGLRDGHARYLTVMDLFQNAVGLSARYGLVPFGQRIAQNLPPMCTSAVVWGEASHDGRLLHARNFDFPGVGVWDAEPTVVFCTPDEGLRYGFVTSFGADVPGVTCFNEAGIVFDAHTRFHRDVRMDATPVIDIGHAVVSAASTLDEAIAIVRGLTSASSYGFTISSGRERRAVVVEVTGSASAVVEASPGEDMLIQTNRYLTPSLQVDEVSPGPGWLHNCDGRFRAVRRCIDEGVAAGGVTVEGLQRLLGDHRDPDTGEERASCGIISQANTVKSVVVDPEAQVLWVSVGEVPTGRGPYVAVPWTWEAPGVATEQIEASPDRPDFLAGPGLEAHRAYIRASRLCDVAAPTASILGELQTAASLVPTDPTYRFLAGALQLGNGDIDEAVAHLDAAVDREASPFQRGVALLWASRARAVASDVAGADALRKELLSMPHPLLAAHREAALRERGRGLGRGKVRGKAVHVQMVDVH